MHSVSEACEYYCINPECDAAPFFQLFGGKQPLHNVMYTVAEACGNTYVTTRLGISRVPMLSEDSGRAYVRRRDVEHLYVDEQGQRRAFMHVGWHTYFDLKRSCIVLVHLIAPDTERCPGGGAMQCVGPMPQPE